MHSCSRLGCPTILNAPLNRNRFWLLQKDVHVGGKVVRLNSMELDSCWQRHKCLGKDRTNWVHCSFST